ncbi:MAG: LamG-like jellyroll fold domain-containing protein [Planctomycetia bacterium]|nr:LamG-like jellyroll fold domain-containing protein [Planctomycetia bacterium]
MNDFNTSKDNRRFSFLCGKYLDGSLSPEEAEELIAVLNADPLNKAEFRNRIQVDFLLHKIFQQRREVQGKILDVCEDQISVEEVPGNLFEDPEEMKKFIDWEKNVRPLSDSSVPRPQKNEEDPGSVKDRSNPVWIGKKEFISAANSKKRSNIPFMISLILLLAIVLGLPISHEIEQRKKRKSADSFVSIARIVELIDVEWGSGNKSFKRGQLLGPNEIALQKGIVKIRTANGTDLILEGPGHWLLSGEKNIFCGKGSTSANVSSKGIGFEILTPYASFIDRGTKFLVEVGEKEAELSVIKGKVDVAFQEELKINLKAEEAYQIDQSQKGQKVHFEPKKYISGEIFTERLVHFAEKITSQRKKNGIVLDRDPRLIARFDFSAGNSDQILNSSARGKEEISSIHLRNCLLGEGSLHGTQSIQFPNKNSAAEFHVNNQYRSLTLIARIRIDQLFNQGNILFCSEGFLRKRGAFIWQITQSGSLQFQLTPTESQAAPLCIDSPAFLTKDLWGTWVEAALVLDGEKKMIRHYLDGKMIEEQPWNPEDLFIGSAILGNRTKEYQGMNDRFLGGSMEEFQIYDKALSDREIMDIFNLISK